MTGIPCPACGSTDTHVVDKRDAPIKIRRRRQCANGHRFNTVEHVHAPRVKFSLARVKKMRDQGKTLKEIAAICRVSISTVFNALL